MAEADVECRLIMDERLLTMTTGLLAFLMLASIAIYSESCIK
jgi:hypothetical protein